MVLYPSLSSGVFIGYATPFDHGRYATPVDHGGYALPVYMLGMHYPCICWVCYTREDMPGMLHP